MSSSCLNRGINMDDPRITEHELYGMSKRDYDYKQAYETFWDNQAIYKEEQATFIEHNVSSFMEGLESLCTSDFMRFDDCYDMYEHVCLHDRGMNRLWVEHMRKTFEEYCNKKE